MKRKEVLTTILALILLLSVITVTYGYFVVSPQVQNQTAQVEAGTMSLTFADNDNGIGGVLNFGESITKKFTIENTGTLDAYAKISWFNITNTYLEGSLVYTLKFSNEENGHYRNFVTEKNVPTNITNGTEVLANGLLIPAGEKYYYELEILLVNSKTVDQTADLNASFWSQFTLESGTPAANEVLASLGLSVNEPPTEYNMLDYTYNGYQGMTLEDIMGGSETTYKKVEGIETTEGLYATEDDFGPSYYFRGSNALNNIVKFGTYDTDMYYYPYKAVNGYAVYTTGSLVQCQSETTTSSYCASTYKYASAGDSMYWRIVRINGDGTLRLMYIGTSADATGLTSIAGNSNFNTNYNDPKYTGYTYDNSSPNVQDGTPSDMKNYLDTWFERSLSDETGNIATSQFYSDSTGYGLHENYSNTFGEEIYTYSSFDRLESKVVGLAETVSPKLKTEVTTETYGGVYYLKVGLLNVDELVLSGYDGILGAYGYSEAGTDYPYTTNTSKWPLVAVASTSSLLVSSAPSFFWL